MNVSGKDPVDEQEWQCQERGRRAARGHGAGAMDMYSSDYCIIAQALDDMPRSEPPIDFANDLVKQVVGQDCARARGVSSSRLMLLVLAWLVAVIAYGWQGYSMLRLQYGDDALAWPLAAVACIGLSWLCGRLFAGSRLAGVSRPSA